MPHLFFFKPIPAKALYIAPTAIPCYNARMMSKRIGMLLESA
jgi:hypothetical protein